MIRNQLEDYILSLGLDTFGFIPCRIFEESRAFFQKRQENQLQNEFEEKEIEKRVNPYLLMPEAKTIISIAFPYQDHKEQVQNGFSTYTKRYDYHRVVHGYLDKIIVKIEEMGGKAQGYVDSTCLSERYLAYLAGVGFIGRNNMLITKKYGSFVFLGEILTSLSIECEEKATTEQLTEYKECGTCQICYGECPSKSINSMKINPNICLSYLTQKKELTKQEIKLLKGNVFGCDYCQLKCPYNKMVQASNLSEFELLSCMEQDISMYARMDNQFFKEYMSKTSCGWRGKNVIKRNALIQLSHTNADLNEYLGSSDYLNRYIELLKRE